MFNRLACVVSHAAGTPLAFAIAVLLVVIWAATGPFFGWSDSHSLFINTATTIVTFLMVFLIQSSQNRDGAALQAKLDEIIRATDAARNEFMGLDRKPEPEIEALRDR